METRAWNSSEDAMSIPELVEPIRVAQKAINETLSKYDMSNPDGTITKAEDLVMMFEVTKDNVRHLIPMQLKTFN